MQSLRLRCLRSVHKGKKEGGSEKRGGENSPISPPLDPRLIIIIIIRNTS